MNRSTLGWLLLSTVQVGVTGLVACALGRICRAGRWKWDTAALQMELDTGLGMLLISYGFFLLSCLGVLTPGLLQGISALLAALAIWSVRKRLWGPGKLSLSSLVSAWPTGWPLILGAGVYLIWVLLTVALPPTAIDELIYHLEIPRQLLKEGGQFTFVDNVYAYFPQLGEMLFLFGLSVGGSSAAKLFHTLFGLLLALMLYAFSRRQVNTGFSLLDLALFVSIPSVMVLASWAYVDLIFSFYTFLALLALLQFFQTRHLEWAVLAAAVTGAAAATKYTGFQLLSPDLTGHSHRASSGSAPELPHRSDSPSTDRLAPDSALFDPQLGIDGLAALPFRSGFVRFEPPPELGQ